VRQVLVFNKIDALPDSQKPHAASDVFELEGRRFPRVFVSAQTAEGLGELRRVLASEVLRRDEAGNAEIAVLHESPV
jgi:GTP-binding protein HflX